MEECPLKANQQFLDNTITFVELSSAFTKRAADELGVHRQAQTKAASLRPSLLQHMLDNKVVTEAQKEAADAMLGSHAETMNLLKAAVDKITELNKQLAEKTASNLGGPEKKAGAGGNAEDGGTYDSLTDPFVGRKTGEKKASDRCLEAVLQNPTR